MQCHSGMSLRTQLHGQEKWVRFDQGTFCFAFFSKFSFSFILKMLIFYGHKCIWEVLAFDFFEILPMDH